MNRYFYVDSDGRQKGTFTPEELRAENVKKDTLVWTQGMTDWKRAEEVDELRYLFTQASTQYPPSYPSQRTTQSDAQTAPPMPKTWMIESILATVLPFMLCGNLLSLLGIIGIVNASQVEPNYNRGDYIAARESSRMAGRWTKIAFWIAIIWLLLIVVGIVLAIAFFGSLAGIGDLLNA